MKSFIQKHLMTHKELCFFLAIAFASVLLSQCSKTPDKKEDVISEDIPVELATYIPKGFSLVPLEIANYQTLDSIFGPFGVVDLYVQDATAKNYSRIVGKNIKLVRAPKNPSHFAALVPENEIHRLMRFGGPFFAIVQNPNVTGTEFEKDTVRKPSRLQFNLGE